MTVTHMLKEDLWIIFWLCSWTYLSWQLVLLRGSWWTFTVFFFTFVICWYRCRTVLWFKPILFLWLFETKVYILLVYRCKYVPASIDIALLRYSQSIKQKLANCMCVSYLTGGHRYELSSYWLRNIDIVQHGC